MSMMSANLLPAARSAAFSAMIRPVSARILRAAATRAALRFSSSIPASWRAAALAALHIAVMSLVISLISPSRSASVVEYDEVVPVYHLVADVVTQP